ncbi:MAG: hypothetical protein ACYTAF_14075 [Planctomycetota bacterium]
MVDIEALAMNSFSHDLQRMGRQLTPGSICAPRWVDLRSQDGEEQLHWGFDKGSKSDPNDLDRVQWRQVRTTRDFLQRFLKLADAPARDIERFANRFGVLGICQKHGLPVSHQEGCLPLGFPDDCHEPLQSWRKYAARMRAVYDLASQLRAGNLGQDEDWWLLYPQFEKNQPFETIGVDETARNWRAHKRQEQLTMARFCLREEMDRLLKLADVGLRLEWQRAVRSKDGPQPAQWVVRVRYGHWLNLFGALVVQLLLEVCESGEDAYLCSGCGKSYTREGRRPNASQNNYCPSCQSQKEPQKQADLRRRHRMREARLLHKQGVALEQIAQRLHTKPKSVARWLTPRVGKRRA